MRAQFLCSLQRYRSDRARAIEIAPEAIEVVAHSATREAGVPNRSTPRHARSLTRLRHAAARPAKARTGLVGSERVRRHPHRRD